MYGSNNQESLVVREDGGMRYLKTEYREEAVTTPNNTYKYYF